MTTGGQLNALLPSGSSSYANETKRSHVVQDLWPYLCTYPQCESGEQLYQHRSDWENHEKYVHRRIWRCPDHALEFLSRDEYTNHVHAVHQQYSSQLLSDEGLRAVESTSLEYERSCPFCAMTLDTGNEIENHIAYHLECIALLTLPQTVTADGGVPSDIANQVDDSRFSDSQLSFWKIDDNDSVITHHDDVYIDNDLREDALIVRDSQCHPSFQTADLVLTWRSLIDREISMIQGGFAGVLETVIVNRKIHEDDMTKYTDNPASMVTLASMYINQKRWKKVEELEVQVMDTMKRTLGEEHPETLGSMNDVASTYWNQGRLIEAEELQEHVIEIRKRVLGEEYPDTLSSMGNLASMYVYQQRWEEAVELQKKVIKIKEKTLGKEHPHTRSSMIKLSLTYLHQHPCLRDVGIRLKSWRCR